MKIESNILDNVPGKKSWRQVRRYVNMIYDHFFSKQTLGFQCQLLLQLIKMLKMRKVVKYLCIYVKKDEPLKQVISTVASDIDSIGKKSQSKDKNMAHRAITTGLVSKINSSSKKIIGKVSGFIKINRKTL